MSKDITDISHSLKKATIEEDDLTDLDPEDEPPVSSSSIDNPETNKKYK
jgi:hypothetical protein